MTLLTLDDADNQIGKNFWLSNYISLKNGSIANFIVWINCKVLKLWKISMTFFLLWCPLKKYEHGDHNDDYNEIDIEEIEKESLQS